MENETMPLSSTFFETLRDGLLEGIAHLEGEIEFRTTWISTPKPAYSEQPPRQEDELTQP